MAHSTRACDFIYSGLLAALLSFVSMGRGDIRRVYDFALYDSFHGLPKVSGSAFSPITPDHDAALSGTSQYSGHFSSRQMAAIPLHALDKMTLITMPLYWLPGTTSIFSGHKRPN